MIIIGSRAVMKAGLIQMDTSRDFDYMGTVKEFFELKNYYDDKGYKVELLKCNRDKGVFTFKGDGPIQHVEFYFPQYDSTEDIINYVYKNHVSYYNIGKLDVYVAPVDILLAIKMSHRFKRNSPHFNKTMAGIKFLRNLGVQIKPGSEVEAIFKKREKETLNYSHPNLNVNKQTFFDDAMNYVYDHDTIHQTQAMLDKPAYLNYMVDGAQVMTSKEKFFSQPISVQLLGVYEESCVLALERSQIPNDFKVDPKASFLTALEKVCTSITSGWFREFAWEHYYIVLNMYYQFGEDDYVKRFKEKQHMLKPFKE